MNFRGHYGYHISLLTKEIRQLLINMKRYLISVTFMLDWKESIDYNNKTTHDGLFYDV
jgi:hypothetical protein